MVLVDAMPDLDRELMRRLSTLQNAVTVAGATALTVTDALCDEAVKMGALDPNSGGGSSAGGAQAGAVGMALREDDFAQSVLDPSFKQIDLQLAGLSLTVASDRRNAFAISFDGKVPIAVRVLLNVTESGDEKAKRNATLNTLNGLRIFLHEYFEYMLSVNVHTGYAAFSPSLRLACDLRAHSAAYSPWACLCHVPSVAWHFIRLASTYPSGPNEFKTSTLFAGSPLLR